MASDPKPAEEKPAEQKPEQKAAALGEDDEFEDFPVDGTLAPHCAPYSRLYLAVAKMTWRQGG